MPTYIQSLKLKYFEKEKEIIGQACCNGVNMGLHFLSKQYQKSLYTEKERKREGERDENKLHEET